MNRLNVTQLLPKVLSIAQYASKLLMGLYQNSSVDVTMKANSSPVTSADLTSEHFIYDALRKLTPELPILSEEKTNVPWEVRQRWESYWLVDPLDGTKEFIHHTGEFSVNIALIYQHNPVMGVVAVPTEDACYWAIRGEQAFWQNPAMGQPERLKVDTQDREKLRVIVSRRHAHNPKLDAFLRNIPYYELLFHGSAVKMCLIARGIADIYPRLGPTSEWDTAAGQCILEASGGSVLAAETGLALKYNTKDRLINPEFFAIGSLGKLPKCLPCG